MAKKCPVCGGVAQLVDLDLPLFDGEIIVKDNPGYRCKKCGEEFFSDKQMDKIDRKTDKISIPMKLRLRRKISKSGNTLIIRIPSDIERVLGITENEEVDLWIKGKKLIAEIIET